MRQSFDSLESNTTTMMSVAEKNNRRQERTVSFRHGDSYSLRHWPVLPTWPRELDRQDYSRSPLWCQAMVLQRYKRFCRILRRDVAFRYQQRLSRDTFHSNSFRHGQESSIDRRILVVRCRCQAMMLKQSQQFRRILILRRDVAFRDQLHNDS